MGKETREQQNGASTAVQGLSESFDEITRDLDTLNVPNIPWPLRDGWDLTQEQGGATDGILIALLRGDSLGSQFLMHQVCQTWTDLAAIQAHIIEILIKIALTDTGKERQIQVCQGMISNRATQG
ncbi:hypothetical protein [Streptomyces sp. NPDC091215]|uniref:hypothetical protein n=1 Tax=Streptomyces sp. NPDC091215 TaxID=3155192 RepID=UPI0034332BDA